MSPLLAHASCLTLAVLYLAAALQVWSGVDPEGGSAPSSFQLFMMTSYPAAALWSVGAAVVAIRRRSPWWPEIVTLGAALGALLGPSLGAALLGPAGMAHMYLTVGLFRAAVPMVTLIAALLLLALAATAIAARVRRRGT